MEKKLLLLLLLSFLSLDIRAGDDDIENLITQEQTEQQKWEDIEGDLPPARLLGDKNAIRIYSPANQTTRDNFLCSAIEFDEILELNRDEKLTQEFKLNANLPRIREYLTESCLVRPGDPFLAVGEGWQELVVVHDFIVRPETPVCPDDPAYSLWVTYEGALPGDPVFFSTEVEWPVGSNGYKSAQEIPGEELDAKTKNLLANALPFSDEYAVEVFVLNAEKGIRVIQVKRDSIGSDDPSLINEAVYSLIGTDLTLLQSEQVDSVNGTGHLSMEGIFDMDGDKGVDLLLKGDRRKCSYRAIYRSTESGFERLDLPTRPCSC